jgi:putative FmdB family regulatory protein
MPIYEYRCLDCGHEFDLLQKFSDPPADTCPSCAGAVKKLISRSAFHLKGDGWYVTDYVRNSGKNGHTSSDSPTKSSDTTTSSDATKSSDTTTSSETKAETSSSASASTSTAAA